MSFELDVFSFKKAETNKRPNSRCQIWGGGRCVTAKKKRVYLSGQTGSSMGKNGKHLQNSGLELGRLRLAARLRAALVARCPPARGAGSPDFSGGGVRGQVMKAQPLRRLRFFDECYSVDTRECAPPSKTVSDGPINYCRLVKY